MAVKKWFWILLLCSTGVLKAQDDAIAFQYYNSGKFDKALPYYERLLKRQPGNFNYLTQLVSCYQQLQMPDKAEELLLQKVSQPGSSPLLLVELGYHYKLQQRTEESDALFEKTLEVIRENPSYSYALGNTFRSKALIDQAIRAFQTGMQSDPNLDFSYDLAYLYGEKGDLESMYNTYLDVLLRRENLKEQIKRNMGRFLYDENNPENNDLLRRLLLKRAQKEPNVLWNELLSWYFIQQRRYGAALVQEKAIFARSEGAPPDGVMQVGELAFESGDLETAASAFTFVTENTSLPSLLLPSSLYLLEIREKQEGVSAYPKIAEDYRNLLEIYGNAPETTDIQIAYARFLAFRMEQTESAMTVLQESLKKPVNRFLAARLKFALGEISLYREEFNKALIYFAQVQKDVKNDELAQMARFKEAQTSFFKGDFDWAETQLKILKSGTSLLIANDALQLKLLISDHRLEDSTMAPLKAYAKASLMAFREKDKEAIALFDEVLTTYRGMGIEDDALLEQAQIYGRLGMSDAAILNYTKIIEFHPQGMLVDDALFEQAQIYLRDLQTPEKARPLLERIIFEHENSIYFPEARRLYRELRGDKTG